MEIFDGRDYESAVCETGSLVDGSDDEDVFGVYKVFLSRKGASFRNIDQTDRG